MHRRAQQLPPLVVLFLLACRPGPQQPRESGFSLRDSAGIVIAESLDSAWTSETAWWIESEPFLEIGSRLGEEPGTDFGRLRDAVRFSDGRIAVSDVTANEIRLFDREGGFIRALGGPGGGPAEFREIGALALLTEDSLVARDGLGYKSVVFDSHGNYGRTVTGPPGVWNDLIGVHLADWLRDGSFFVTHLPQSWEWPPGRNVVAAEWHYFNADGEHVRFLKRLPARYVNNVGRSQGTIGFGPLQSHGTDGTGIWHAFPLAFELHHLSPRGLDRIVRRAWDPVAIPDGAKEEYRAWYGQRMGLGTRDLPQFVRDRVEFMEFADTLPAFETFLVARDGYLWVELNPGVGMLTRETWERGRPAGPVAWCVMDPEGRWLGTVMTPADLRVTEIGEDYILGIWRDELDVPYVRLYRLVKPDGGQ